MSGPSCSSSSQLPPRLSPTELESSVAWVKASLGTDGMAAWLTGYLGEDDCWALCKEARASSSDRGVSFLLLKCPPSSTPPWLVSPYLPPLPALSFSPNTTEIWVLPRMFLPSVREEEGMEEEVKARTGALCAGAPPACLLFRLGM